MKRSGDFFILFLFLLIFSCSSLILFRSVQHSSLQMATPLKIFETRFPSSNLEVALRSFLIQMKEKGEILYRSAVERREGSALPWLLRKDRASEKKEEEAYLPAVNFRGLEMIYLKRNSIGTTIEATDKKEEPYRPEVREMYPQLEREKRDHASPLLLILHSHTAETYWDDPRDIGTGHVAPGDKGFIAEVGRELAETLSLTYGLHAHHVGRAHDSQYSLSYRESRKTVEAFLKEHPKTGIILDIHRDALGISAPEEITTTIKGQQAARVLIIVASDELGLYHPTWRNNLQFATLLGERMGKIYPGLLRRIEVRENRLFNQDLHPRSILLEVGDYRSSTEEALFTAELLADVLYSLQYDL